MNNIAKQIKIIVANTITQQIKNRIVNNRIRPQTHKGRATLVQTGTLYRSIQYKIQNNNIIIFSNVKYAAIHHTGGTIYPKKSKFLAIPLNQEAKKRTPQSYNNSFVIKIKNKGLYIARPVVGKSKNKIHLLYKLVKQVKIPKRPYLFVTKKDIQLIFNRLKEL